VVGAAADRHAIGADDRDVDEVAGVARGLDQVARLDLGSRRFVIDNPRGTA